jgi:hypothetical protein
MGYVRVDGSHVEHRLAGEGVGNWSQLQPVALPPAEMAFSAVWTVFWVRASMPPNTVSPRGD